MPVPPPPPGAFPLRERLARWPILQGAVRWATLLGSSTVAAAAASVVTLVANAGILRLLPKDDAGHYALWFAVGQSIAILSQLGQGAVLTRTYVRRQLADNDWPRDLAVTMGIVVIVAALAVPVAVFLYRLTPIIGAYLFAIAVVLASTYIISSILNSHRQYVWSSLVLRLPNSLMILTLPALLLLPDTLGLPVVLGISLLAGISVAAFGIAVLRKHVPRGTQRVTVQERMSGSIMMVSNANNVVPEQGLLAIAGIFVPPAELASLAALTVLIRPMQLLQDVFYRVFMTEVARRDQMRYPRILAGLWLLAITVAASILLIAPPIAHWAYGGRYDQALGLLPWLALTSVLKLGETFPRSHMIGAASMTMLRRYTLVTVLTAVTSIGLGFVLTVSYGLLGTVMTGSAIFALRNLVSYGFLTQFLRERRESAV